MKYYYFSYIQANTSGYQPGCVVRSDKKGFFPLTLVKGALEKNKHCDNPVIICVTEISESNFISETNRRNELVL